MRHKNRKHKLGASGPHRSAMMGNLSVALITHGRIETTLSKARALRPFIEKVITLAKKADKSKDSARKLHLRRLAISRVRDKVAVGKLFDERAGEFTERNGGYTRIYKLGQRIGDAAEMALIELIDGKFQGMREWIEPKYGKFDFVWFDCGGPPEYEQFMKEYWDLCSEYVFFHFTYFRGQPNKNMDAILNNATGNAYRMDIVEPNKFRQGSITMLRKVND